MLKFKEYLEEGLPKFTPKGEATFVEDVIIHCINTYNTTNNEKKFIEISKKDRELVKFVTDHKKVKISNDIDAGMKELFVFAKTLHQKIGSDAKSGAKSAGKDYPKISPFWKKVTGKSIDTSKADILIGKKQVSVKKSSAQLMSGGRNESKATLQAAFGESDLGSDLQESIIGVVDKFAGRTQTEGLNTRELSQLDPAQIKSEVNKEAREVYDNAQDAAAEIKVVMETAMKSPKFLNAFAYEAMTGWEKFAGKTFGAAGERVGFGDTMLIVSDSLKQVKWDDVSDPSKPMVSKVANEMKFEVSMKSNSYKVAGIKAGYGFYQTVRLGVETVFDQMDKLQESCEQDIAHLNKMLSEGYISEGKFKDAMKNIWNKLRSGIMSAWNKMVGVFKKIVEKVKQVISDGFQSIMEYFSIDYLVSANVKLT